MRIFIIKLLIFVSPLILFIGWWEVNLARMPNRYKTNVHLLSESMADCEVLILGSSHPKCAIDPSCLKQKAVNMAEGWQALYADAEIVAYYLPRLPKLKIVVLSVSYHSLEELALEYTNVPYRRIAYHKYYHLPTKTWADNFDVRNFSMIAWYGVPVCLGYLRKGFTEEPFKSQPKEVAFNDESGKLRVDEFHGQMDPTNIAPNRVTLLQTIVLCQKAKVIPVLVTVPVYRTFRAHMDRAKYERMQDVIHGLCDETGVRYFNYLDDARFDIDDFGNIDHLNWRGAEKFSRILDSEVLQKIQTAK